MQNQGIQVNVSNAFINLAAMIFYTLFAFTCGGYHLRDIFSWSTAMTSHQIQHRTVDIPLGNSAFKRLLESCVKSSGVVTCDEKNLWLNMTLPNSLCVLYPLTKTPVKKIHNNIKPQTIGDHMYVFIYKWTKWYLDKSISPSMIWF